MKKCKSGGKVKIDDDMKGNKAEETEGQKEDFKRGGKAKHKGKHKKHGGKIDGKKPHHRADKFARGGKAKGGMASKTTSAAGMSPSSPLSGAGKTKELSTPKLDKEDD